MAQHRHPVRQILHLVQLVGDNDNGLAVVPHVAQHGEKLVRFLGGQDSSGLVQDQNVGAPVQHLDDLHRLLLGHGHIINLLIGVHLKAIGLADAANPLCHLFQVQPPRLVQAQDDVLRRGEHIHQLEVLMNHADAQVKGILGGADHHFLAVNADLPLVGEVDAGEHIHQGGFAAAVLTQQGQNLAPVDVQPDLVVGHHRAEGLGDVAHSDCGSLVVQSCHSCRLVSKISDTII